MHITQYMHPDLHNQESHNSNLEHHPVCLQCGNLTQFDLGLTLGQCPDLRVSTFGAYVVANCLKMSVEFALSGKLEVLLWHDQELSLSVSN